MTPLHTLRNTPWLARLALLWFVLTLGAAVASPLVNPQTEVLICSGMGGMAKVTLNDDGTVSDTSVTLSCPLCMTGHLNALVSFSAGPALVPLTYRLPNLAVTPVVAWTAVSPPSRGPPLSL